MDFLLIVMLPISLLILYVIINRMFRKLDMEIEGSDSGYSSLIGGKLRRKDETVFNVLGDIDELNSHIGFATKYLSIIDVDRIGVIQRKLMEISSVIAGAKIEHFNVDIDCNVLRMENWINEKPNVHSFVIPSNYLHVCRAVCRRAERSAVGFGNKSAIKFLNRLSKYLYSLSR